MVANAERDGEVVASTERDGEVVVKDETAKDREDHQEDVKMRRSVKIHDREGSDREGS